MSINSSLSLSGSSSFSTNSSFIDEEEDMEFSDLSTASLTPSTSTAPSRNASPFFCASPLPREIGSSSSASPSFLSLPNAPESDLIKQARAIELAIRSNANITTKIQEVTASIQGSEKAEKISKTEFHLDRSLHVTGNGEVYAVFCSRKRWDQPFGSGGYKEYFDAVNLNTWEVASVCAEKKENRTATPLKMQQEYYKMRELTDLAIPGSFYDKKRRWLVHKMEGDLLSPSLYIAQESVRLHIAQQMAQQLANIHAKGFAHLDVKEDNYLFKGLQILITDLGLTTKLGTSLSQLSGSLLYLSPEALRQTHKPYQHATVENDSWALGIALLCLFEEELDPYFLTENPRLQEMLEMSNTSQLFTLWLGSTCLTQSEWILPQANDKSLEYVISMLLMINPALRWSAQYAANYLRMLHQNSCKK